MVRLLCCLVLWLAAAAPFSFGQARFDLDGPKIDIRVTRGDRTLPIAAVPNLEPGDRIWLHADLPPTQSVHYLLIASFLRGTTNPPPDDWFTRIETWQRKPREEGVTVTVPAEAQQAVLFLAPETGGDFSTLRSAVRGRPGIFVRASQDLTEAGFEQARIEKYVASMKLVPPSDPAALLDHSNLLARTLNLRPNADCFKRPLDQQYNCLTQTGTQTLLDDGHGQSIAASLSTGPSSDLINAAAGTQLAGGGSYSAYVGAMVDFVRLMNGLHTAQFQYIPAIAFPTGESLNLRLNTAPSFHNPKSVLVIGMPAIRASVVPPLRVVDPNITACVLNPKLVLPIEGAPLVFSTGFAHDLVLRLNAPAASARTFANANADNDLPLVPDAFQGGLMLVPRDSARKELPLKPAPFAHPPAAPPAAGAKPASPAKADAGLTVTGTVQGMWGFDPFTGPTLKVQLVPGEGWHVIDAAGAPQNLIAGKPNHLAITSSGTACVQSIRLAAAGDVRDTELAWKPEPAPPGAAEPRPLDLELNLQHDTTPGALRVDIQQFGRDRPDQLGAQSFRAPARIDAVVFHAGDTSIGIKGAGLDGVAQVLVRKAAFTRGKEGEQTSTAMSFVLAPDQPAPGLRTDEHFTVEAKLDDGRTLEAPAVAMPPRPAVTLLSRRVMQAPPSLVQPLSQPGQPGEMPLGSQLLFFLKSNGNYPRTQQIEIASADGALHTRLSIEAGSLAGSLVLVDAHTVLATFDPLKTFGPSTFGPLRLRALAADGTEGSWLPLVTVVRLPALTALHCESAASPTCELTGQDLYRIAAVAATQDFAQPVAVPEGFVDETLSVPRPTGSTIYLKLRDDPDAVQTVVFPAQAEPKHPTANRPGS